MISLAPCLVGVATCLPACAPASQSRTHAVLVHFLCWGWVQRLLSFLSKHAPLPPAELAQRMPWGQRNGRLPWQMWLQFGRGQWITACGWQQQGQAHYCAALCWCWHDKLGTAKSNASSNAGGLTLR